MLICICVFAITLILLFPKECTQSAREALSVWGFHVVPSLFPYMVLSKMLSARIKEIKSFPSAVVCMSLGAIGGAPSGASILASYHGRFTYRTMLAVCTFVGTVSPMFFLGTLRSWLADPVLCRQLLISQYFAAAVSSACVYLIPEKRWPVVILNPQPASKTDSPLTQSIDAVLHVGGCIICFSVVAGAVGILLPMRNELYAVLHALIEISGGMHAIAVSEIPLSTKKYVLAFVAGFSGFSVLSQSYLFVKPLGVRMHSIIGLALLRAVCAAGGMFLMLHISESRILS